MRKASELKDYVVENRTFLRYDLSTLWKSYDNYTRDFKILHGREIFTYELLDNFLRRLAPGLSREIKKFIHSKDFGWFEKIGQYLFYNLIQWNKPFNKDMQIFSNYDKQNNEDFFEEWWKFFLNYKKIEEKNTQNVPMYPSKILLELTNNCNLNCVMCGVGAHGYDESRNMKLDLLECLCREVLNKVEVIRINGLGESTIIHNFLDYLRLISHLDKKLEIVTNLTIQNAEIWKELVDNNTNFLISCDSVNPDKYERIRRGAKFNSFLTNLRFIGNNVSDPLQAQIIFTLMKQNIDDLPDVIRLSSQFNLGGVNVNVVKLDQKDYFSKNEIDKIKSIFRQSFSLTKELDINLKLPDHIGAISINPSLSTKTCKDFCINPWNEVYIRYNGDLTPCNMLNPYLYGNLRKCSFCELWNGLNANLFRNFINTKYRHTYCKDCYYLL